MSLSTRATRRGVLLAGLAAVAAVSGCGVVLTGGLTGAIFATSGSSGGATANQPAKIDAAAVTGDTSGGTVTFNVTISDAESDGVRSEVRYTSDPNESASRPFAKVATGTFGVAGLSSASAAQNGGTLPASPGGASFAFSWNTAQDLGATRTANVRLQIVIDGSVGFTVSPFTVDNTGVPLVVSAAPSGLPAGATVYSDDQNNFRGYLTVPIVLAQSEGASVDLTVSVSTDGGATFPNAAVGRLVNAAGVEVALTGVATSQGGTSYTFRFLSASGGIGATGDETVVLRFVAKTTKTGSPRDTAPFVVNNAAFSATVQLPSRSEISDKVEIDFYLYDAAQDPVDVLVQVSPNGLGGTYVAATEAPQPPSEGSSNLATSPTGKEHHWMWNAFYDMIVRGPTVVPATFNASMQVILTKRKTQVQKGPYRAPNFTVDQRLIETVFNRGFGADSGTAATSVVLGRLGSIAQFGNQIFFSEPDNAIVRVVDFSGTGTPTADVLIGTGPFTDDGELARDFGLGAINGLAASRNGSGALLIAGATRNYEWGIFRVDGATPFVTSLFRDSRTAAAATTDRQPWSLTVDPLNDRCYYAAYVTSTSRTEIRSISTVGLGDTLVAGGGTNTGENVTASTAAVPALYPYNNPNALAANFSLVADLVFYAIDVTPGGGAAVNGGGPPVFNVRAINTGGGPRTFAGTTIGAGNVATVVTALNARVGAISVNASSSIDLSLADRHQVIRIASSGTQTVVAGTGAPGFSGDGSSPTLARLTSPTGLCNDNTGGQTPGSFFVCDTGNGRVRRARNNIQTVAGSTPDVGDGQPAPIVRLAGPSGIASVGSVLLITDTLSSRLRAVDLSSLSIVTLAGTGVSGVPADNRQASSQPLSAPTGIARRGQSDIYVSLTTDNVVELLSLNNAGTYETHRVAGLSGVANVPSNSTDALTQPLSNPKGLAFHGGFLVIGQSAPDPANGFLSAVNVTNSATTHYGVTIQPGGIARIAGGGVATAVSGSRTAALGVRLDNPTGIVIDKNGTLYVADSTQDIVLELDEPGVGLQVIGGNPALPPFPLNDGSPAVDAPLLAPIGLALDEPNERVLYVHDSGHGAIRGIKVSGGALTRVQNVPFPLLGRIETIVGLIGTYNEADGADARNVYLQYPFPETSTLLAENGNLFYPDQGGNRVRMVDDNGIVTTIAGSNVIDTGDTLQGTLTSKVSDNSTLTRPTALAVAPDGRYYVMDSGRVRVVSAQTNVVTRVAGTSYAASLGSGVPALQASFAYVRTTRSSQDLTTSPSGPRQLALSGVGYVASLLAVADTMGRRIAIANLSPAATTLAGLGTLQPGELRPLADPPALARPSGVAFTTSGLVIFSDEGGVGPPATPGALHAYNTTSTTLTCCGINVSPGTAVVIQSPLNNPGNVAFEARSGLILFTQLAGAAAGGAQLFALNPTAGPVTAYNRTIGANSIVQISAYAWSVRGVAVDPRTGDAFYSDSQRHQVYVVRFADGTEIPFAGRDSQPGFSGDGGIATSARLNTPAAVGVDAYGTVYVLDQANVRVRRCRSFP